MNLPCEPEPLLRGVPPKLVERLRLDALPFHQRSLRLNDMTDLSGKRVLVTGGGGRGLGRACCERFAGLGAAVAVLDVDHDAADRVARDLRSRWEVQAEPITASITSWDGARQGVDETVERLGGLDVLVNNAGGLYGRQWGPFAERTARQIEDMVALNLLGAMFTTRAALDHMLPAGTGRIVNVSSEGGRTAMRGLAVYNACKAGVIGLTRNLAHELGPRGITVVGVAPGVMISEGLLELMRSNTAAGVAAVQDGLDRATIGRTSLPEEVANVVAFLATEAGAYIHGTTVSVGGGLAD